VDAERFLFEEVENLGKAIKCESSELLIFLCSKPVKYDILPTSADVCLDNEAEA
jgi:hypothetical protein